MAEYTFDPDTWARLDLEPYVRRALDQMNVEIEAGAEDKVADVLRERGWTCTPPRETEHPVPAPTTPALAEDLYEKLGPNARHALGIVELALYANRDSSAAVTWRNDEVVEMLEAIRSALIVGPESPISETSER